MLSNKDKYIKSVCDVMDETVYSSASAGTTVESWMRNKEHFFKKFGNKTIVQTDEIPLDIVDQQELTDKCSYFIESMEKFFLTKYKLELMRDFFYSAVGKEGFKDNKVISNWTSEKVERSHIGVYDYGVKWKPDIKIDKGMKFSKALRHFFNLKGADKIIEEERLKEMQDLYSTYRQNFSTKSNGKLFLSIHPLDYLTISDNNHNWSSCHNMYDGEYRMGNLNYMADGVTMVAYYASNDKFDEELEIMPEETWNSKRWRVLVHLEEVDGKLNIIYNKQYPFKSTRLLTELDNLITGLYSDCDPSSFISYDEVYNTHLFESDGSMCCYIDIRKGSGSYARLDNEYLDGSMNPPPLFIGEEVYCVTCGKYVTTRGETGQCDKCCDEWYCDDCDGYYVGSDMIWIEGESRSICYDCFENLHQECPQCGEETGRVNLRYVDILGTDMCPSCWDDIEGSEGTLIYTINDSKRQFRDNPLSADEITRMYERIYKEEKVIIDEHLKNRRITWTFAVMKPSLPLQEETSEERAFYRNQLIMSGRHSDSRYSNQLIFRDLEYQSNSLPLVKDIIILGSTSEDVLTEYMLQLNNSLEALGMTEEVTVDSSRVKIL